MKKLNEKKVIRLGLIITMSAIILLLLIHSTSLSYKKVEYNEVYVSSGDTLWKIAKYEMENNDYYKAKEIREIVFDIKKVNNLSNSELTVNQKLFIPSL